MESATRPWTTVAVLAITALLGVSACSNTASSGDNPALAAPIGAQRVGPASPDAVVPVVIRLAQQVDDGELQRQATAAAIAPTGQRRAMSEIAATVGASDQTVSIAASFFSDSGVSGGVDPSRTYAEASMTSRQVAELFGVALDEYRERRSGCQGESPVAATAGCGFVAPAAGASLRVPDALAPALASGPPDSQISGFSTRQVFRSDSRARGRSVPNPQGASTGAAGDPITNALDPSSPPWWKLSGVADGCADAKKTGAFSTDQLATAYSFPSGSAKGIAPQTVALIALDQAVDPESLKTFAACMGVQQPSLVVDALGSHQRLGAEATEDAEMLTAFGGSVIDSIHVVTGSQNGAAATNLLSALARAVSMTDSAGKPVDIVSISYAACEAQFDSSFGSTIAVTEAVLSKAALAGVSVVAAAGDAGSSACAPNGGSDVAPAVNYPASSAWVTAVGGTNLMLDGKNAIADSGVWNDAVLTQDGQQVEPFDGGGGGVSTAIDRPTWQSGPGVDTSARRQVPDVAYMADDYPGIAVFLTPRVDPMSGVNWFGGSGTSLAAPMFAAAIAQYNARHDGSRLGFVNPRLYPAVASGSVATRDIVTGTNIVGFVSASPFHLPDLSCCRAGPRFDTASGWGSVDVDSMLKGLG